MYFEALYGCMPFEGENEMKTRKFKKWPEKKTELVEDAEKELIE